MARASLFVLSSRCRRGFGNVLVELACGCPIVATNCVGDPADILEGGRFGRLVPVGDIEAMAQAILEALETLADGDALRRRARWTSTSTGLSSATARCWVFEEIKTPSDAGSAGAARGARAAGSPSYDHLEDLRSLPGCRGRLRAGRQPPGPQGRQVADGRGARLYLGQAASLPAFMIIGTMRG